MSLEVINALKGIHEELKGIRKALENRGLPVLPSSPPRGDTVVVPGPPVAPPPMGFGFAPPPGGHPGNPGSPVPAGTPPGTFGDDSLKQMKKIVDDNKPYK
jgi:hypothetical protein